MQIRCFNGNHKKDATNNDLLPIVVILPEISSERLACKLPAVFHNIIVNYPSMGLYKSWNLINRLA